MERFKEILWSSFELFRDKFVEVLPKIVGGVVLLIIGWIIAKLLSYLLRQLLKAVDFDNLADLLQVRKIMDDANIHMEFSRIVSKFVYWVILLLFLIVAVEVFGWTAVSYELGELIRYLPKLFGGLVIFVIGLFVANFIKDFLQTSFSSTGFTSAQIVSRFVYFVLLVIVVLTALNQIGINTRVISANITIIIAAVFLAFAIAFGVSSKGLMQNILASSYNKNNFQVGQEIRIGEVKGEIIKLTNISVILKTSKGIKIIPAHKFIDEEVEVLDD